MSFIRFLFFTACIKIIKYTDLTKSTTFVYLSTEKCFKALLGFLVIVFIIVCAFVILGHGLFGDQVNEFSTIQDSLMSTIKILMQDFHLQNLRRLDKSLIMGFFVLIIFVAIFILLNMLVAMVFHVYYNLDFEVIIGNRKYFVWDIVIEKIDYIFEKCKLKNWIRKRKQKRFKNELKHYISYLDVVQILKRSHFTDNELKHFLDRFKIESPKKIHESEARQLYIDMSKDQRSFGNNSEIIEKSNIVW
ncbi:polycystin-2-like [Daktulosphaira vitifoliae]|uniref:polycystin-2-like n=1 Tax=Daktulosphaira vitifoliae TaxID=58002 RepID=UPI0021AA1F32|nr:polycystin-2-like [Daktulosphaira vitifoliae]